MKEIEKEGKEREPYEQLGIQEIQKLNTSAKKACAFQTMIIVQPTENDLFEDEEIGKWKTTSKSLTRGACSITMQCFFKDNGIKIKAHYGEEIIRPWEMQRLLEQFECVLEQLPGAAPDQNLEAVKVPGW